MPHRAAAPRLWLQPERRDKRTGRITHCAVWIIKDRGLRQSTKCPRDDRDGAEKALEQYLNRKHAAAATASCRDPAVIPVADVLSIYAEQVAPKHARPKETLARIMRLGIYFGDKTLADINGEICRAYVKNRSKTPAAREELILLRAAINFHREEGHCDRIVSVTLTEKSPGRERWLTRNEAAKLIWRAWRYREVQKGHATGRRSRKHVARFILVGLYTGTRASAICGAALERVAGAGYIDLEHGIFYRRPAGAAETKKRRPPAPLAQRLLAHLRRWKRRGQRFAVEWNDAPVKDVDKAFRRNARAAGMSDVTPHTLRHTSATWLMQEGVDLWEAAGFLGMSVEQLERNYGHHHPDHLRAARDAFDRRPGARRERKRAATVSQPLSRNGT